jgi:hypothetical protein
MVISYTLPLYGSIIPTSSFTILRRLEPPTTDSVTSLSAELNISRSAIYAWLRVKGQSPGPANRQTGEHQKISFHVVLDTYTLTEEELATYCRRKWLYHQEVKAWKEQRKKANALLLKDHPYRTNLFDKLLIPG